MKSGPGGIVDMLGHRFDHHIRIADVTKKFSRAFASRLDSVGNDRMLITSRISSRVIPWRKAEGLIVIGTQLIVIRLVRGAWRRDLIQQGYPRSGVDEHAVEHHAQLRLGQRHPVTPGQPRFGDHE